MAREGLSEIRGILQSLLEFQVKNGFGREDLLLFLGLVNITMAMNLLHRRMDAGGEMQAPPAAGGGTESLAALGQLLAGRVKGTEGAGAAAPLAGLLGREGNLPALISTMAGLLKQCGGTPAGAAAGASPGAAAGAKEAAPAGENEEQAAGGEDGAERPAEKPSQRTGGRREPLRWDFGRK